MIRKLFDQWAAGGELPQIAKLIGFRLTEYSPDKAVMEFDAGPQHSNPMGSLHGGVLCDIADAAMGTAWATRLEEGETFTTIELKINFFRPVWTAHLTATANVIRRGKTLGYIECDVRDDAGNLVARAASSCMTLRGDPAKGR